MIPEVCIDNIIKCLPLYKQKQINKKYQNTCYKESIYKIMKWYKKNKLRLEMEFEFMESERPMIAYLFLDTPIQKRDEAALFLIRQFPNEYPYILKYRNLSRGLLKAMKTMDIYEILQLHNIITNL